MISTIRKNKKLVTFVLKPLSVILAVCVWQIASAIVGEKLILPSPVDVVKDMLSLLSTGAEFWSTVCFTFSRIAIGFFSGLIVGTLLAVAAGRFRAVELLLYPYVVTVKSVPVASFVILALIWLTSSKLAAFVSFLMVFPVIYNNLLEGIRAVDRQVLEMARVFRVPLYKRLKHIWLPELKSHIVSACGISLGLAWKSGVAAELIGYPDGSLGEKLYYSKVYFDTSELFAWTVFIIIFSVSFEKLFMFALKKLLRSNGKNKA